MKSSRYNIEAANPQPLGQGYLGPLRHQAHTALPRPEALLRAALLQDKGKAVKLYRLALLGAQLAFWLELARRSPFCRRIIVATLAALIARDLMR